MAIIAMNGAQLEEPIEAPLQVRIENSIPFLPRNPARRISCDSARHREAKPHGKERRRRWLRRAKK
jgi:hypothetical protein